MAESTSPLKAGVTVVVPVYNSEKSLEELAKRLSSVLDGQGLAYEMILINDGSRDQSWQEIRRLSVGTAELPNARCAGST